MSKIDPVPPAGAENTPEKYAQLAHAQAQFMRGYVHGLRKASALIRKDGVDARTAKNVQTLCEIAEQIEKVLNEE